MKENKIPVRTTIPPPPANTKPNLIAKSVPAIFVEKFDKIGFNEELFESRYPPRFEWFKEHVLLENTTILNLGCSTGYETFALMWDLKILESVGVDKDTKKIESARGISEEIIKLRKYFERSYRDFERFRLLGHRDEHLEQLLAWYENDVPKEIRKGSLPQFIEGDISTLDTWNKIVEFSNHFDLVYCRHVLHFIEDSSVLATIAQNLAKIIRPQVGRFIVVEPIAKNGVVCNFVEPYFQEAGLELMIEVEDEAYLGGRDANTFIPKGYIFRKNQ